MNTTIEKRPGGRPRRILTPTEKSHLKEEIQVDKADKEETDTTYPLTQAKTANAEHIKRVKKELAKHGEEDSLSPYERAEKEKDVKALTDWLVSKMLPRRLFEERIQKNGVQSSSFAKSRRHVTEVEMSTEFVQKAEDRKNLLRELGRSEETSLELIRPE